MNVGWAKARLRRAHHQQSVRSGGHASLCPPYKEKGRRQSPAALRLNNTRAYLEAVGYLNSGAAFIASLVVFIDASHLSFFWS